MYSRIIFAQDGEAGTPPSPTVVGRKGFLASPDLLQDQKKIPLRPEFLSIALWDVLDQDRTMIGFPARLLASRIEGSRAEIRPCMTGHPWAVPLRSLLSPHPGKSKHHPLDPLLTLPAQ